VVVHPRAEEAQLVVCGHVAGGEPPQLGVDGLLGLARGQVDLAAFEAQRGGDAVEQLLDRVDADRGEHRLDVLRRGGGVAAHASPLT
jgi:hypothetical protein